jgi:hypothetical protein
MAPELRKRSPGAIFGPAVRAPDRLEEIWSVVSSGRGADRHLGCQRADGGPLAEGRIVDMRYVMIIAGDETNWFEPKLPAGLYDEVEAWWTKWHEAGKIVEGGAELQPSGTAKTVGAGADGLPTVTDGPYLELKEVIGGFIMLVADDIDDAVAVAATWPGIAAVGDRVEVRPIMER